MQPIPPADATLRFQSRLNEYYRTPGGRQAGNCRYVDHSGDAQWVTVFFEQFAQGKSEEQCWQEVQRRIDEIWGITPPPPDPPPGVDLRPIQGYVRPGPTSSAADDSGPRSLRFCSYFPGLRIWRDAPDECKRQLDLMVGRWHGARVFWHLANPWAPDNLDVRPSWSNYDLLFHTMLHEFRQRGLRVSLTAGDLQYLTEPKPPLFRRIANLCASVDQQTVSLVGMVNEARVNSTEGEDWNYWAMLLREWQAIFPWGLQGLSDPGGDPEEPAGLYACSRSPASMALLHGTRHDWKSAIRRAFNVRYEGVKDRLLNQDEPTNMHGPKPGRISVYQPLADQAEVFGLHSVCVLTGQIFTFFGDAALTNRLPLDSDWGFRELPALWRQMEIPENIGTYKLVPGHHAGAPVTVKSFQDPGGSGPDRCDNMVAPDGSRGFAVLHGGSGTWQIVQRDTRQMDLWTWQGHYGVGFGEASMPASAKTCVVSWHR